MAWWKEQENSDFKKQQLASLDALNKKLAALNHFAYPYEIGGDYGELDFGGEEIMTINRPVVARTQAKARKANAAS